MSITTPSSSKTLANGYLAIDNRIACLFLHDILVLVSAYHRHGLTVRGDENGHGCPPRAVLRQNITRGEIAFRPSHPSPCCLILSDVLTLELLPRDSIVLKVVVWTSSAWRFWVIG